MPLTLEEYDALLVEAGVPNLDPSVPPPGSSSSGPRVAPIPPVSGGTAPALPSSSANFYVPQVDPGLATTNPAAFRQEYARQAGQFAHERFAEGTIGPQTQPQEQGQFTKGLGSGVEQVKALVSGGGAALMDVFGLDSARDYLIEDYMGHMASAQVFDPAVGNIEEIDSLGKFFDWAAFHIGEQVPTIASIVASGGIGGVIAKVVGKKAITASAGKLLQDRALGLTAEAAAAMAKRQMVGRGVAAGVFGGATTLESGGILGEQVESGLDPQGGVALIGGSMAGALETLTPLALGKLFGLSTPLSSSFLAKIRDAATGRLRTAGAVGVGTMGAEATTEALQEVIAIGARSFVDENYDALGPESASRIMNSAATGALLGGLFGGIGGAVSPQSARTTNDPEADLLIPPDETTPSPPPAPPSGIVGPPASATPSPTPSPPPVAPIEAPQAEEVNAAQAASVTTTPIKITGLTSNDVNPIQQIDTVDLDIPGQGVIVDDRETLNALKQERAALKSAPESYTKKGNLRAPVQRQVLALDDAIATEAAQFGLEEAPSSEALVTEGNEKDLSKLKIGQRKVYNRLLDKIDNGETLTASETVRLDDLASILEGDPIEIINPDVNEKTQLLHELEEATNAEILRDQRERVRAKRTNKLIRELENEEQTDTPPELTALFQAMEVAKAKETKAGGVPAEQAGGRVSVEEAQAAVQPVRLINEGLVVLAPSSAQLRDPRVKAAVDKQDNGKFETQAVHVENDDGSTYTVLLLDRMGTPERVAALYLHEVLVHHGLRALDPASRKALINLIKKHRLAEMQLVADQRGVVLTVHNQDVIAEEVLAEFAENNDFDISLWNRIVAIIRQWVRKLLPGRFKTLSDNDVRMVLLGLQRKLGKAPARVPVIPTIQQVEQNLGLSDSTAVGVTTKFIEVLHSSKVQGQLHKGTLTQGQLRSLAKRHSGSAEERDLVLSVLDQYTALRLSPSEVEQAIITKLLLFDNYVDTQSQFGDFAIAGSQISQLFNADEAAGQRMQPQSIIYTDLHRDQEFRSNHYITEPFYRGHIRGVSIATVGGVRSEFMNIEVQSDFAQNIAALSNKSPEDIRMAMAIDALARSFHTSDRSIRALEGAKGIAEARFGVVIPQTTMLHMYPELETGNLDNANIIFIGENRNLVNMYLLLGGTPDGGGVLPDSGKISEIFQQIGPTIFKRLIREDVKRAAEADYQTYSFAHPDVIAEMENWDITNNPGHLRLYNRYKKLYEWFRTEYRGHETTERFSDHLGGTRPAPNVRRIKVKLTDKHKGKVTVLAGGRTIPGREATNLGTDVDMRAAVDKLHNPLWAKFRTTFSTMLQLGKQLNIQPLNEYLDRLTDWSAEKGGYIAAADQLLKATNKELTKREQATLSRIIFTLTARTGDVGRALTPSEIKAIYRRAKVPWSDGTTEKGPIQNMQERYAELLDDVNAEMQDAAMYQVMYRLVKMGKQYSGSAAEARARELVKNYNDTDEFSQQRQDIIDEIELLVSPQENQQKLDVLNDAMIQLAHLKQSYENMRGKNYFPYKRFGKWAVIVRARKDGVQYHGQTFDSGETAGLWTFENRPDQMSWADTAEMKSLHQSGEFNVESFKLSDVEESHVDIPPGFLDSLKQVLGLEADQETALDKYALRFTPGSKFVSHMMQRRGIDGMSEDMQRTFATYMQSAANHIARVNHAARMVELQKNAIALLKAAEAAQPRSVSGTNVNGINVLEDDLKRHFQYIMSPGNEMSWLRSLGFTWYLGFNIKSSIVNLTQVPMVAFPYLSGKYGTGKAFASLMKAIPDSTAFARKDAKPVEPWLDKMMARGTRELFLDESLGVELAGAAQGDIMSRVLPANPAQRVIHRVGHLASLPFQFTEKITRRVVFIATTRLQLAGIENPTPQQLEDAYIAGREAVRETIFEYQKWNRPRFMRGKTSSIFLFWTFMQHMLFTLGGGYGKSQAAKVWGMMFIAAGTMGLPLAENILDLLDWGGSKAKKALGSKDPHLDARLELRKLFQNAPGGADLWMYGLSSRAGLGPLHVLDLLGAPIPQVDVQGSVGLGRPIPGLEELTGRAQSTEERFGRVAIDVLGPVAAIFYNGIKAFGDTNPDTWKSMERALPASLKSISKATRISSRGGEEFRRGGTVIDYDPNDMEHNLEMISQMFGFTPTRLNDRYKLRAHQEDHRAFYMTWRQMLLEGYNYARMKGEPEGKRDALDAIKRFNKQVPDRRLKIGAKSLRRSRSVSDERAKLREQGKAFEKGFRRDFRDIAETFPQVEL